MLQIRLLGELELVRDGRAMALPASKKTRALLGYLAVEGRAALRERLCELLWEGPDDPRAQLRWSLSKLRPLLGDRSVELSADRERIELRAPDANVDLRAVRRAVGREISSAPVELLRQAAAHFRGELLDGLDLPGCYRYQAWLEGERESARSLRVEVLQALSERLDAEPEEALKHARAWLAADPLGEAAHAQVVRCLAALGRRQEALKQIDACRELFARELGSEPTGPLERARVDLNTRRPVADPAAVSASPGAAGAAPSPPYTPYQGGVTKNAVPLVGRAAELRIVDELVARARDGALGEVVLVTGEAGLGKTRILEELAVRAGGRVLSGRAFEAEMVRPYGAWIDALRPLPNAAAAFVGTTIANANTNDRERLFDAVAQLLASESRQAPLLVILDDLHWLDEASVALLSFVARANLGRVMLAAGARPGELSDNTAALKLTRALARDGRLRTVELAPLDATATAELVKAVGLEHDENVFAESAGNPLFALEVARARLAGGDAAQSLDALIGDRFERLEPRARELLPYAAALGRSFAPELLERSSGAPAAELVAGVETLERAGILRSSDDGARWDFVHDLVRNAAYRRLSLPRRRLVHGQISRAIAQLPDDDGALASDLAHHAGLSAQHELATRACITAAERALRLFAADEADELAERGLHHVTSLPPPVRLPLSMKLYMVRAHARRACTALIEEGIVRATVEAESLGLMERVHEGFSVLSLLRFREEDYQRAQEVSARTVDAVRSSDDPMDVARAIAFHSRCLALIERDLGQAKQLVEEACGIEAQNRFSLLEVRWAAGLVAYHQGDYRRAVEELTKVGNSEDDHWRQAMCLQQLVCIALELRTPGDALSWCTRLADVASKLGEGSEAPFAAVLSSLVRLVGGEKVWKELEAALADLRRVDAKTLLAYALNTAAELDLEAGRAELARARATEALGLAEAVERLTERTIAHMILGSIDFASGDRAAARAHIEAVLPHVADHWTVTWRARKAVSQLAAALTMKLPLNDERSS
jgi:DNA-binding SARP family transcriptional activator/predicted ATPase